VIHTIFRKRTDAPTAFDLSAANFAARSLWNGSDGDLYPGCGVKARPHVGGAHPSPLLMLGVPVLWCCDVTILACVGRPVVRPIAAWHPAKLGAGRSSSHGCD
jgi:hypothetical protein